MSALLEFLRRQFFMVFHYSRGFWALTAVCWTMMVASFWGSLILAAVAWGQGAPWWWLPLTTAGASYALGVTRVLLRQAACRASLPELQGQLKTAQRFERWAHPIASLVGWAGFLSAAIGNSICWRGITYWLDRNGKVSRMTHPSESSGNTVGEEDESEESAQRAA